MQAAIVLQRFGEGVQRKVANGVVRVIAYMVSCCIVGFAHFAVLLLVHNINPYVAVMLSHSASVATYDETINRTISMLLKNYEINEMFQYFVSIFWNRNKLSK